MIRFLCEKIASTCEQRVITKNDKPYITRFYLWPRSREVEGRWGLPFRILLHKIDQADTDWYLHDHPWSFLSVVLAGGYTEELVHGPSGWPDTCSSWRGAGSVAVRGAERPHRVIDVSHGGAWTLVIAGPRRRLWGYWTPFGWIDFKKFHGADGWTRSEISVPEKIANYVATHRDFGTMTPLRAANEAVWVILNDGGAWRDVVETRVASWRKKR